MLEQGRLLTLSRGALRNGLRAGMRANGALAIAPDAVLLERNPDQEQFTLNALALALLQFTPDVAHMPDVAHDCIVLDVTASLRLFGGVRALCRRLTVSVGRLGLTLRLGAAPTATGAWLLARAPRSKTMPLRRRTLRPATLTTLLDRLPCSVVPASWRYADWLTDIGADTLGGLRKLPRAGLLRRTDSAMLAQLDRAYGQLPELFAWIKPPEVFSARMETFDRIEHADALLHGATHLVVQLIGWLVALHKAVLTFVLLLEHERGRQAVVPTELEISLAEPAWHEQHLLRLLQERLARTVLSAPVIAIRLEVRKLADMLPPSGLLFPEPGGTPADLNRLLELLSARIGKDNVLAPSGIDDYRPEVCNAWMPAAAIAGGERRERAPDHVVDRPFWILAKPVALIMRDERPFYGSPLRLLRGPERIEAGWWDNQSAARDYFVAQGHDASCYWIYLERSAEPRWFLHGMYA